MKYIIFLCFLLPLAAAAQKIKTNKIDKFTKERIIETSAAPVKNGKEADMAIGYKSVGSSLFIFLSGHGLGANTISPEDNAVLLLENDSTVTIQSTGLQTFELTRTQNAYNHQYQMGLDALEMLSRNKLKSVRKYYYKGYTDIEVSQQNREALKKLSQVFINELAKEKIIYSTLTIRLDDISKHVGDSVVVCGKIYGGRYLQDVENKPTLLNMGAAYPDQPLTVVIWGADRKTFGEQPETFYRNKEVCIVGKVELYREKPQIVIKKPSQLQVKSNAMATN